MAADAGRSFLEGTPQSEEGIAMVARPGTAPTATTGAFDGLGPIDYLVVEFPEGRPTGEGLPLLVDLVERSVIRILDLTFVVKGHDGTVSAATIADLDSDGQLDLAAVEGASSGLLGQSDYDEVAATLRPGSTAGVLVYENTWAAPLAAALRRSGAVVVASERLPVQAVLAALDATEGE
jgi:hypothetical protein